MTYDFEKERREAIEAGHRALYSLQAAAQELRKAGNWGILDMLGSRSFLISLIKHSKMENAQQHMEQARHDLSRFSSELNDVNMACHLNIDVSGFLSFADVFMDNIFVDWMVQSRIRQARDQVDHAIFMVQDVLDRLESVHW